MGAAEERREMRRTETLEVLVTGLTVLGGLLCFDRRDRLARGLTRGGSGGRCFGSLQNANGHPADAESAPRTVHVQLDGRKSWVRNIGQCTHASPVTLLQDLRQFL